MLERNGSKVNRADITDPVLIQKRKKYKRTTLQWPSDLGREEDDASVSALKAWVSCDLRWGFIFEPAPRETRAVRAP